MAIGSEAVPFDAVSSIRKLRRSNFETVFSHFVKARLLYLSKLSTFMECSARLAIEVFRFLVSIRKLP